MHFNNIKPLFEVIRQLSKHEAEIVRHRLLSINRRRENSRLLELFDLIAFQNVNSDIRAARAMNYERPGSAYANTKKRLLAEVLTELHQLELAALRINEFPDDQIILHQVLADAHLMWKRGKLELAVYFFNEAYGLASLHEDYFLLISIAHRLKVLSTFHSKTFNAFERHAQEVENATKSIQLINDLSTAYYKLRFAETFFSNRYDYECFAMQRLEFLRKIYKQASTASIKVQALNQMIQCHEAIGAHHSIKRLLQLILKLQEFLPPHSLTSADVAIKQARFFLLKNDCNAAAVALRNNDLQKVIASNRLFIYSEWLVLALVNSNELQSATTELNKLKMLQDAIAENGRFVDIALLDALLNWHKGNYAEAMNVLYQSDWNLNLKHLQLKRWWLLVAIGLVLKDEEMMKASLDNVNQLINENMQLNSPRNRALLNALSTVEADKMIEALKPLQHKFVWHPLCDDVIAIDKLPLNALA